MQNESTLQINFGKHFFDVTYDEALAIRNLLCEIFGSGPAQTVVGAYKMRMLDGLNAVPPEPPPDRVSKEQRVSVSSAVKIAQL